MRIAFVNEYFLPFAPGGAEWSTYYLARALIKKGHEVHLVTPNYGAPSYEIMDGIEIYRFPFPKIPPGQYSARYFFHNNLLYYFYNTFWIWWYLRKKNIDIIHAQNRYSLTGAFISSKILGKPLVFTIRDVNSFCPIGICTHRFDEKHPPEICDFSNFWNNCGKEYLKLYFPQKKGFSKLWHKLILFYSWLDTKIHQLVMNKCQGIAAVSWGILNIYLQAKIIKNVKTEVVYNLPPPEIFVLENELEALRQKLGLKGKRVVLFVGKISIGKGAVEFLKAAQNIIADYSDVVFLLVGKKNIEFQEKLSKQIKIVGSLPNEVIQRLYHLAEMVVVPSRMPDALSRVLLEGMAAGKPLIGTITGGTPEIIKDDFNGLLVEKNVLSLEKAIRRILEDRKLAQRLSLGNKIILEERFNEDRLIKKLLSFYQKCKL